MKSFIAPKKIEFEMPNLSGEMKKFSISSLPPSLLSEIEKCETVISQLEILFGKEENFKNFDARLLRQAVDYVLTEIKNPT